MASDLSPDQVDRRRHSGRARGQVVVWKFGGTSVSDHTRLRAAAERMVRARRSGLRVVAVLSAMGKSTDELSAKAYQMTARPPLREMDALMSVGEQISCSLASMVIGELGSRAVSLTAAQAGILTDSAHGNARLVDIHPDRVWAELDAGMIVLVAGYQGVCANGDVTTMGRGGSDATAVALAAALGVPACEIFTDVPGVCTADPRVVPEARPLHWLRHAEMLELAEAGAGVLQPRSVELAACYGVDIHLRSSFTGADGTWVRRQRCGFTDTSGDGVVGIAHREHEPLILVRKSRAADVVAGLAERGIGVGTLASAGDLVRFTVPEASCAEVTAALDGAAVPPREIQRLGTASVVSAGIARKPRLVARVLAELAGQGIEPSLVSTTSGRVTVHIPSEQVTAAVQALHRRFVPAAVPAAAPPFTGATPADVRPVLTHRPIGSVTNSALAGANCVPSGGQQHALTMGDV